MSRKKNGIQTLAIRYKTGRVIIFDQVGTVKLEIGGTVPFSVEIGSKFIDCAEILHLVINGKLYTFPDPIAAAPDFRVDDSLLKGRSYLGMDAFETIRSYLPGADKPIDIFAEKEKLSMPTEADALKLLKVNTMKIAKREKGINKK